MRPDDFSVTECPTDNRPLNAGVAVNNDTARLDGVAKVTGRARYGRDQYLPNAIFAAFIRCPYGNAELESADRERAAAVPGVVEVEVSGKRGSYHGATIGHLAADSPLALRRGLRALNARWKRGTPKTGIADGLEGAEPGVDEAANEILEKAEERLEAVYSTQVQTHSCLETHGCSIDFKGDSAAVYASTQGTFSFREGLSDPLGLPNSKFEVVCEYIGGGFGSKFGAGREGLLAARLAGKHKRPCYVFCDREEEHLDTGNRPSGRALVRVGFNKDGTILGGEIRTWGGVGVDRGGGGMRVPSGRYRLGDVKAGRGFHTDVSFNAGGPRAFRAPGHPQGAFVEELMLDEIATRCGIDPLALRQKLDVDDDRREMMELGSKLIGWKDRKGTGSQEGVVRRGFGMGTTTWHRGRSQAECEVVINRDGSVEARTGTQDIGTGQRTAMAVITAERLGIPVSAVTVRIGHSTLPVGPASGGSVTSPNTAPAMAWAAGDARKQFLENLAHQAAADPTEFEIKDGVVTRAGRAFMPWKEACARMGAESIKGTGKNSDAGFQPDVGHSHGVQFVDLHVDTETGVVRVDRVIAIQSCGRVLCRKTAESQVIGGVIQGISFALFEDRILDRNTGAMVNPNLEWYKILGTVDMPHIEPVLWTKGQTGVRSIGEPPTVPTAGAVAGAIFNAIGKPVRHLPMTPDRVLAALAGVEGGLA